MSFITFATLCWLQQLCQTARVTAAETTLQVRVRYRPAPSAARAIIHPANPKPCAIPKTHSKETKT